MAFHVQLTEDAARDLAEIFDTLSSAGALEFSAGQGPQRPSPRPQHKDRAAIAAR